MASQTPGTVMGRAREVILCLIGKKGDWTSMAFVDLYGAWKIEKKNGATKGPVPFFSERS